MSARAVVVAIALVCSCRRAEPPKEVLRVDEDLLVNVTVRVTKALERPSVSRGFDALLDSIGSEPTLMVPAAALLASLSSDPKIEKPLAELLKELVDNPEVQKAVTELMVKHPEATPDQIGDLVGKQFEEVWSSKPIQEAWMQAFRSYVNAMRDRPEVVAVRTAIERRVKMPTVSPERLKKWNARIVELEGGKQPDAARAKQVYLDRAWSDERIDAFATTLANNAFIRKHTAKMLADLLAVPSLRTDIQTTAANLLGDPEVRTRAKDALVALSSARPPIDRVLTTLERLLTAPGMTSQSAILLGRVTANKEVIKILENWWDGLRKDPTVLADVDKFLDGW
jgi:hypothetical protein